MHKPATIVLVLLAMAPVASAAQNPPRPTEEVQALDTADDPPTEPADIFDVWRKLRGAPPAAERANWDYRQPMKAFAPVIGAKPSAGVLLGAAGNVAFYRGDPSTTHLSSMVASLTFSTKGQTAITDRFTLFLAHDRWRIEGDHRFQWTSLESNGLGTAADTRTGVEANFDFFRLHHTAYYRLAPGLFAGGGLYFDNHVDVHPRDGEEGGWDTSPYVEYTAARGLPLEGQGSAGVSVDLQWDTRDNFINAKRGWLAEAGYRRSFNGFLGGDSDWDRVNMDLRSYQPLSPRQKLAVWFFAELGLGGDVPYWDLPATGFDTYGRSARGYGEGQFRGERLVYGEIEYRATLMRNGLLGMVAFLNTTTVTNLDAGEQLFDSVAIGGGAGLRLRINKRSQTNLCFDVGFGKQGSRGVYLAIQEAF